MALSASTSMYWEAVRQWLNISKMSVVSHHHLLDDKCWCDSIDLEHVHHILHITPCLMIFF